jgi:hypothetical protein
MLLPTCLSALFATVHLALAFAPETPVPPAVIGAASAEAAEIWSPYGVVVGRAGPGGAAPDHAELLTIAITTSSRGSGLSQETLGAIAFDADGTPRPRLTVFFNRLMHLISLTPTWMVGEPHWPRVLRDRVVGRALGRVIAHEIGHFVLRTSDHTSSGLMRQGHGSDDLIAPDRSRFTLWPPGKKDGADVKPAR